MCKKISIFINSVLTEDKGYPMCYTAYKTKSVWYKIFDKCFFWQKQHCRKAYLSRKLHENTEKSRH